MRVPEGFKAATLLFSNDKWAEICSRYLNSKSEMRRVLLSEVYRMLALEDVIVHEQASEGQDHWLEAEDKGGESW